MKKAEVIGVVAEKAGVSKKVAEEVIAAYTDLIASELAAGETFPISGFGTFSVTERASRVGRNPRTGEELTIPASKSVHFKAGKTLKDSVAGR